MPQTVINDTYQQVTNSIAKFGIIQDSTSYGNADVLTSTLRHMGREVVPANLEFKAFKKYEVDTNAYVPDPASMLATTVSMTLLPVAICAIAGVYVNVKRKFR